MLEKVSILDAHIRSFQILDRKLGNPTIWNFVGYYKEWYGDYVYVCVNHFG